MRIPHFHSKAVSNVLRMLVVTSFNLILAGTAFAQATGQPIAPNQTPQDLVNALHSAFGTHHARAVHAKGTILEGSFKATSAARMLSEDSIFSGAILPVTARFSDFTGIPDIPDNIGDANPRGFAFKIKAADGTAVDIVSHSFNGFPVATADEFAALLRDIGASGPGIAHPTPIEQFLATHPVAKNFLTTQKPPPVSYATTAFFGVNSFKFTNAKGQSTFVRYRFVPRAGERYLTPAELKTKGPNYLQEEIGKRAAMEPIVFDWYAQISQPEDKIEDPSVAWPESRKLVKLGTITINKLVTDQAGIDKQLLFLPGSAHPGIDPADPMLIMRNQAYPISYGNRQ
ncbi:catalase family peroxidase [Rhodanobacter sp. Soil772]|uniref:catalase family peroxidase n=1 Tax=Rhodanobacter sp. Soil772 TaxID=1736406 RepID=UPI000A71947A|nr:catalase family peroxidase [Rhodanobacter sp. Soil772]